jgi:putative ABC transport system permease protein
MSDLRQAIRSARRRPAISLATVLILGLGIGAAATMYAVVRQVLLRPLPVRDQDRLAVAWGVFQRSSFGHVPLSYIQLDALRRRTRVFEQVAGLDYNGVWDVVGRAGGEPVPLRLGVVTGDLFGVLGTSPIRGRALAAADDRVGAAPVTVISEGLWRRRFGGDPGVLGRPLSVYLKHYTIVGVMPGDFELPAGAEAWVTLSAIRPDAVTDAAYGTLDLVGRLRPGLTVRDARAELDRLLLQTNPGAWGVDSRLAAVVQPLRDVLLGRVRPALLVLLAAALLVFLVAALNLCGLLTVRSLERRQEFAMRRALGATRLALARQVTTEAGLLVGLGSVVGVALAWAALRVIPVVAPQDLPRIAHLQLDAGVALASVGLALVGLVLAGLLPAWAIMDAGLGDVRESAAGRAHTPGRTPARGIAVAAQTTVAVVTVATALLLGRTLQRLERLDIGFEPAGLSLFQVAFLSRFKSDEQAIAAMDRVLASVQTVPGVQAAANVIMQPLSGTGGWDYGFMTEGQTDAQAAGNPYLNYEAVTPQYFEAMRLPIVKGRGFGPGDRASSPPVVVIGRGIAERMWPGQDPIGKRIRWAADSTAVWRTVVGIAADARYRDLLEVRPTVYLPVGQQPWIPTYLIVRSALPLESLAGAVRSAVRAVDADLGVVKASPVSALLDRPLAQPRFNAGVLLAFAAVAALVAALGLFGLVSFVVAQRTREIGIRLAVGAQPRQILSLVLRRGLPPVAVGCALGIAVVLAGGRLLGSVLYEIGPGDPVALSGAVLGFGLIATMAALLPARRAAATDPSAALRQE